MVKTVKLIASKYDNGWKEIEVTYRLNDFNEANDAYIECEYEGGKIQKFTLDYVDPEDKTWAFVYFPDDMSWLVTPLLMTGVVRPKYHITFAPNNKDNNVLPIELAKEYMVCSDSNVN